ncbi:restriction endonuclease subunit S [Vibrio scophthalmi]|uniref:restriction endonuclease subunit S n=1 Tax=Vibrio scophthalmi TaxID=45658 RepID=UPI003AAF90BA
MSVERLITDNIDVWTSTVKTKSSSGRGSSKKRELYGIKKLRELILELAVRGKLVPQDPTDEPVSLLLERIVEEKAQLVKEKKIKNPKKPSEISDDEKPFDIPEEWKWIRLNEYAQIFSGNAFKSGDFSSEVGAKTIKITNAGVGNLIETDEYLPEEFLTTYSQYRVVKNDLILALTRPYIADGLKVSMCPDSYHNSLLNQRVAAIRAYVNPEYAFFMLRSPYVLNTYKNRFSGSGLQPNLKMSDVTELVIPICSEQEQHRIVAKVDELMTLCDQLEQQTEASIDAHQVLVTTLLDTLTNSADTNELIQNWARISEHFDTLFTTEASIDQLKQTILQLAVMGKLVPQDPNDEPAAKLLERIAEEKAQLVKEKQIKKQKALPPIAEDEKPFELPKGWEWCRLGDLELSSEAGWSPKCLDTARNEDKWGVLKVSAVTWGKYNPDENKELPASLEPREHLEVQDGDFLISRANTAELVAKAVVVPADSPRKLMMSDKVIRFKFSKKVSSEYINLFNNSLFSRNYYSEVAGGTSSSMKNVSREQIKNLLICLPPAETQQEIIDTLGTFYKICDQLKRRLRGSQQTQLQLTDAMVEKVL